MKATTTIIVDGITSTVDDWRLFATAEQFRHRNVLAGKDHPGWCGLCGVDHPCVTHRLASCVLALLEASKEMP